MFLEFDSFKDYEKYFSDNKVLVSRQIVHSIEDSFEKKEKNAIAFEIGFSGMNNIVYEISVDEKEWINSLESCLRIFTDHNASDDAIDTYFIKKKIVETKEEV